jgi:hypothetical protein
MKEVQEKLLPGELGVSLSYELSASWLIVSEWGLRGLTGGLRHLSGRIDRRGGAVKEPSDNYAESGKEALAQSGQDALDRQDVVLLCFGYVAESPPERARSWNQAGSLPMQLQGQLLFLQL